MHDATMRAFQLLTGTNKVVLGLFHLRVNHSALINRQREAQTNFVLAHIAIVILGTSGTTGFRTAI